MQGEDDFKSYYDDTMRAGHGENNPAAVESMIRESEAVTDELITLGVDFARNADGSLAATREGGHSRPRILYHEDCTGREITTRLMEKVSALENVEIVPETVMLDIIPSDKGCFGIVALEKSTGKVRYVFSDYTVLASGGIGGVFPKSTNFRLLTGDGVAICLKRGVAVDNTIIFRYTPLRCIRKRRAGAFSSPNPSAARARCFSIKISTASPTSFSRATW